MGKKIDLNEKKNNNPTRKNKNSKSINNPYYQPTNDIDNEENSQEEFEENDASQEETNEYNEQKELNTPNQTRENKEKKNNDNFIKKAVKLAILKKILALLPIKSILLIGGGILLFIIFIVIIIVVIFGGSSSNKISMGGYYSMRCPEVTVIFTDKKNGYAVTGTGTYSLEEYVAGVVAGEVGFLGSIEVDKAFAVAARTFLLTHDDGTCTIESSDRRQVFRELTESPTDILAMQAAEETAGQVLLSNNELYGTQYDAFACIAKDDNYYTISQANQKIPKEWVESKLSPSKNSNWFICNGKENLKNHHGNGMSQYGALYLATEQGYTYDEIINFYLGDNDIKISTGAYITSIAGLEVKDTTNSEMINDSLQNFLSSKGSSVEQMEDYIYQSVSNAGKGTREGVVTAAVSFINFLYDNFNIRLPYYWGGEYQKYGVNPSFGGVANSVRCSPYNTCYAKYGFDCSGFVSWAIKNGGYILDRNTTSGFAGKFSDDSCDITSESCIGQPGDLINSSKHVQLIVAVDQESGQYMVAESTGGNNGLIMRKWNMHSGNCGSGCQTKILHMDNFYNDSSNVDPNY